MGLLVGSVVAGCGALRYTPNAPVRGGDAGGHITVQVDGVEIGSAPSRKDTTRGATFSLRVRTNETVALRGAHLASSYERPCEGGEEARFMRIDGIDRIDGAPKLLLGEHRVDVAFGGSLASSAGPSSVDLDFDAANGRRCARVDALTERSSYRLLNQGAVGIGIDAYIPFHSVAGVPALIGWPLQIGRWFGPVRVAVEPGLFGVAVCDTATCGHDARGRARAGVFVPFGAGATIYPIEGDAFGLGLELRWRQYATWIPDLTGDRFVLMEAPAVVAHAGIHPRSFGNLPAGSRVLSFDVELPMGVIAARDRGVAYVEPMLGLGLSCTFW